MIIRKSKSDPSLAIKRDRSHRILKDRTWLNKNELSPEEEWMSKEEYLRWRVDSRLGHAYASELTGVDGRYFAVKGHKITKLAALIYKSVDSPEKVQLLKTWLTEEIATGKPRRITRKNYMPTSEFVTYMGYLKLNCPDMARLLGLSCPTIFKYLHGLSPIPKKVGIAVKLLLTIPDIKKGIIPDSPVPTPTSPKMLKIHQQQVEDRNNGIPPPIRGVRIPTRQDTIPKQEPIMPSDNDVWEVVENDFY